MHAGPAGYGDLAEQLREAVASVGAWMAEYGEFVPHPSLDVQRTTCGGRPARCTSGCGKTTRSSTPAMPARCSSHRTRPR